MFNRNICQFVPNRKTELDLRPLHFVLEANEIGEKESALSVHRIYFVLDGQAVFKNNGGAQIVKKNDVIFCLPAKKFSLEPQKGFRYAYISYIGLRASQLTEQFKISDSACVFKDVSELELVWKNALPAPPSVIDLRAESVILYTYSAIGARVLKENAPLVESGAAVEVKKFVDAHFSDPTLSLSTVCAALAYSPKYISSLFAKRYGVNFSKYLNTVRVEHACSLIERGHTSISTVASMCGYLDALYFSKVFKSIRRIAPRDYVNLAKSGQL